MIGGSDLQSGDGGAMAGIHGGISLTLSIVGRDSVFYNGSHFLAGAPADGSLAERSGDQFDGRKGGRRAGV